MDVYCEHLVKMKKDSKSYGMLVLIWLFVVAISALAVVFIGPHLFCLILIGVAVYGAVQLTKQLDGEYEYILTNGEMDVDIITAKSSRKRIITFNCSDIERIEKFNAANPLGEREKFGKTGVYCNKDDKDAYSLVIKHATYGSACITLDIPVKIQEKMLPFLNKLVARDAFKD